MGLISHHATSVDGFIAGPDDAMDGLFGFGQTTSLADETMRRVGALQRVCLGEAEQLTDLRFRVVKPRAA